MKNKKIGLIVVGVIVLAGVFYGGMTYGKSQIPARGQGNQVFNQNGAMGARGTRGGGGLGGFTGGEIISKDDKSITVKLMNGDPTSTTANASGSKIIFLDGSTTVTKTATGTVGDLAVGTQVSVTGTPNSDGSITAKSIQIRPQVKPNIGVQ
jgi:Domain of unknown function (DUF5666)